MRSPESAGTWGSCGATASFPGQSEEFAQHLSENAPRPHRSRAALVAAYQRIERIVQPHIGKVIWPYPGGTVRSTRHRRVPRAIGAVAILVAVAGRLTAGYLLRQRPRYRGETAQPIRTAVSPRGNSRPPLSDLAANGTHGICRAFRDSAAIAPLLKVGRFTPKVSVACSGFTPTPSNISAGSTRNCSAPRVWSSTLACTAKGWSRAQALKFMAETTFTSEERVASGNRPLHRQSSASSHLQNRPAGDLGDPRRSGKGARQEIRHPRLSRCAAQRRRSADERASSQNGPMDRRHFAMSKSSRTNLYRCLPKRYASNPPDKTNSPWVNLSDSVPSPSLRTTSRRNSSARMHSTPQRVTICF